jgi:copper chaperone NosL
MTVSESKFGAELITKSGKVYKFDSVGSMLGMYKMKSDEVGKVLISDFFEKDKLIEAKDAIYFKSSNIHGPMGTSILATQNRTELDKYKKYIQSEWEKEQNHLKETQASKGSKSKNDSASAHHQSEKSTTATGTTTSGGVSATTSIPPSELMGQELKWQELVDSF